MAFAGSIGVSVEHAGSNAVSRCQPGQSLETPLSPRLGSRLPNTDIDVRDIGRGGIVGAYRIVALRARCHEQGRSTNNKRTVHGQVGPLAREPVPSWLLANAKNHGEPHTPRVSALRST